MSLLVLSSISPRSTAYEAAEHTNVGEQARGLFLSVAQEREWCGVTPLTSQSSWGYIAQWLVQEDEGINWFWHFWDPRGGDNDGLWGYDSAYTWAQQLFEQALLPAYEAGDMEAYIVVGRIAHLVADMGVPAHVLNDPHPLTEPYEKQYIAAVVDGIKIHYVDAVAEDITENESLYEIMYRLAIRSQQYPSSDCDGTVYDREEFLEEDPETGFWGFKPGKGLIVTYDCYRGAIGSVANWFQLFFSIVRPSAGPLQPINTTMSGFWGQVFDLYGSIYGVGQSSSHSEVTYCLAQPTPNPWGDASWATAVTGIYGLMPMTFTWRPDTLDHRAWLRVRIWDSLLCESPPIVVGWVDVDSTPPAIMNVSVSPAD